MDMNDKASGDLKSRNVLTCRRMIVEGYNKQNPGVLEDIVTPGFTFHLNNVKSERQGPDALIENMQIPIANNNTFDISIEDIIADEDKVAFRWVFTGVNRASGKTVTNSGVFISHFRDGKMVEAWQTADTLSTYVQLGFALTPPVE